MRVSFWKKPAMLVAVATLSQMVFVARAQPDLNEMPKAENPTSRPRPNRPANGMGVPDEAIRKMMEMGGVPDVATQDAVLAYMKEDMEARKPLRDLGLKLFQALRAPDITDEQMLALVTDYRAAQETEKVRREQSQNALDAKVNFTQTPRLEAMLLLTGLIGDGGGLAGMGPGGFNARAGQVAARRNGQRANAQGANEQNREQKREENRKKLLERFDKNANGQLDPDENLAVKEFRRERRDQRQKKDNLTPAPRPGEMPLAPQDRAPDALALPDDEDDLAEDLKA